MKKSDHIDPKGKNVRFSKPVVGNHFSGIKPKNCPRSLGGHRDWD
jgi:hypothetical protein